MKGISFKIPNKKGYYLKQIFNNVDIANYSWNVCYQQIIWEKVEPFFPGDIISGHTLSRCIDRECYIIFSDLKAFENINEVRDITTYTDFVNSKCKLILLIDDQVNASIYSKDNNELEMIHKNCIDNNFSNIVKLSEKNDSRTRLSVW